MRHDPLGGKEDDDADDDHGSEKDREDAIGKFAAFLRRRFEALDEIWQEDRSRDQRANGGEEKIRDAESGIVDVEGMASAECGGQKLVSDQSQNERQERENCQ